MPTFFMPVKVQVALFKDSIKAYVGRVRIVFADARNGLEALLSSSELADERPLSTEWKMQLLSSHC
jgi:hypothetical protein